MVFSTTIKRKYWDMKMKDEAENGFFLEYKSRTSFWSKRMQGLVGELRVVPCPAVFLIGSHVERRMVEAIWIMKREDVPESYRGALSTDWVFCLKCSTSPLKKQQDGE